MVEYAPYLPVGRREKAVTDAWWLSVKDTHPGKVAMVVSWLFHQKELQLKGAQAGLN